METVHKTNAITGLDALYDDGPWDEVWLDWSLGVSFLDGDYMVRSITQEIPENVGKYYCHTSDPHQGRRMVRRLRAAGLRAKYYPDIDYGRRA